MSPSAAFTKAWEEVKTLKSLPSNEEQLNLYGYGKIARDEDFDKATKPGMFDLKGKAKYGRWEQFVKEGVSAKEADDKYVDLVDELKKKYGVAA